MKKSYITLLVSAAIITSACTGIAFSQVAKDFSVGIRIINPCTLKDAENQRYYAKMKNKAKKAPVKKPAPKKRKAQSEIRYEF